MHLFGEKRHSLAGKRLWVCDWCGNLAPWDDNWSWYGSYKEQEIDGVIVAMCSDRCRSSVDPLTVNSTVTAANVLAKIAPLRALSSSSGG